MKEILLSAALSRFGGWYNTHLFTVADHYGSLEALYDIWLKDKKQVPNVLCEKLDKAWTTRALLETEKSITSAEVKALLYSDPAYPELLHVIADKPYVLFYKGNLEILSHTVGLSCVGTRLMSAYGKRCIATLVAPLQGYELCIISGLALGVDGEVHKTALAHSLATIAVLGGGLDRYEPVSNARIAEGILNHGGCLLSEYPPGVRPQKHHFLERNRIIAALSRATIVIEGKHHSGSLVTARYALQYGREVGVVPGDIFSLNSEGPLRLLKEGAWPITSGEDILAMLGIEQKVNKEEVKDWGPVHMLLKTGAFTLDTMEAKLTLPVVELRQQVTLLELEGIIGTNGQGEYYLLKR